MPAAHPLSAAGPAPEGARHGSVVRAVVGQLFLVFQHLPVELVGERVDRRVHVGLDALGVEVLAAYVQVRLDFLSKLVHRQDDADVDHVVEMTREAVELRDDVVADGGRDLEVIAGEVQVQAHSFRTSFDALVRPDRCHGQSDLRRLTGGIASASRYFATVRRATRIPCSPSTSAILLSVSGVFVFSAAISCLISARIAVADAAPPVSVATWLPKKY